MRKYVKFAAVGVIVMTGCVTTYQAGAPEGCIDVIAHRGASAYAPENTLAAFALAAEQGADWFELDCTLAKDGEVVVIHDNDLERTTDRGAKDKVADLTIAELKTLDAGAWKDPKFAGERLPTLAEALDFAQGRIGVYIEIKNAANDDRLMAEIMQIAGDCDELSPRMWRKIMNCIRENGTRNLELTRKVIDHVRARRMKHQIVIQSFSPVVCAIALEEAPDLRTEFLASKDDEKPERWPLILRWEDLLNPHGFNVNLDSLDPGLLARVHGERRSMAVWTLDDAAEMRRVAEWGADAIITNVPDVCLRVLKEIEKH